MTIQQVYRWRLTLTLFLLVVLGLAECAESGWFGRCRWRRRRCRPVVCEPTSGGASVAKASRIGSACDPGQVCPFDIIGCFELNGVCQYCSYDVYQCPDGAGTTDYTGDCGLALGQDCNNCLQCIGLASHPSIGIPSHDPNGPSQDISSKQNPSPARHLIADAFWEKGLPPGATLKPGKNYNREVSKDPRGHQRPGVVVKMQLRDKKGELVPDEFTYVHLDWLTSTDKARPRACGLGYETTEPPYGAAKINNSVRITDTIYSLRVVHRGQVRHYIVQMTHSKE